MHEKFTYSMAQKAFRGILGIDWGAQSLEAKGFVDEGFG
jgi:hypothetical protein